MKAVILAGGVGSRLSEETDVRPKPMVEVGGRPILWHIMKIFTAHGITDFVICCGYKGHVIKHYFASYFLHEADCRFDLKNNRMEILRNGVEPWRVAVIDTGQQTMTGGRLRRVRDLLDGETFCLTYGDGVSDVNVRALVAFHRQQRVLATLTAVQPPGRFGALTLGRTQTLVTTFSEKPGGDGAWINGGFFVMEPAAIDYIDDDLTVLEKEPLQRLAKDGELAAYKHEGFWQPMDTLRDKLLLESLWATGTPPWKVWEEHEPARPDAHAEARGQKVGAL